MTDKDKRIVALEEALLATLPISIWGSCVFCLDGTLKREKDEETHGGIEHLGKGGVRVKCLWHEDYLGVRELLKIEKGE